MDQYAEMTPAMRVLYAAGLLGGAIVGYYLSVISHEIRFLRRLTRQAA